MIQWKACGTLQHPCFNGLTEQVRYASTQSACYFNYNFIFQKQIQEQVCFCFLLFNLKISKLKQKSFRITILAIIVHTGNISHPRFQSYAHTVLSLHPKAHRRIALYINVPIHINTGLCNITLLHNVTLLDADGVRAYIQTKTQLARDGYLCAFSIDIIQNMKWRSMLCVHGHMILQDIFPATELSTFPPCILFERKKHAA